MNKNLVMSTAEPFFFQGDRVGCLLVHGFTGTPREMRWFGEYLAGKGHTVLGIRLAGHATQPADMVRTRWWDWLASVEDGLNLLKQTTDHIFVMGLSMGAVLSLLAGERYSDTIEGVISLSCPYSLPDDWRINFLRPLSFFKPSVRKGPPNWHDTNTRKVHVNYPRYPTRSIAELKDLLEELHSALPKISLPVLLMQSHADTHIAPDSMELIYEQLGTANKQKIWFENSGHVLTEEPDREEAFQAAEDFMMAVLNHHNSKA